MEIYYVTFAGHRSFEGFLEIEEKLEQIVLNLLKTKSFVEFYVSNDGEFDIMATSAIRRAVKSFGDHNSSINLVLAYPKANMDLMAMQFNSIIIPEELYGMHYKRVITAKNFWLVDHSDLLISYVRRNSGGAFNTLKYAEKKGVEVLYV